MVVYIEKETHKIIGTQHHYTGAGSTIHIPDWMMEGRSELELLLYHFNGARLWTDASEDTILAFRALDKIIK